MLIDAKFDVFTYDLGMTVYVSLPPGLDLREDADKQCYTAEN